VAPTVVSNKLNLQQPIELNQIVYVQQLNFNVHIYTRYRDIRERFISNITHENSTIFFSIAYSDNLSMPSPLCWSIKEVLKLQTAIKLHLPVQSPTPNP